MLHEFLEPALGDGNALLLWVLLGNLEALLLGLGDDVLHVLLAEAAQDTKEELPLRQLVRELLLRRQVLLQLIVLHRILVEVLHGDLRVGGNLEADDLVLLQVELLLGEDVAHEAELGGLHGGQEDVDYMQIRHARVHLPWRVM